MKLTLACAAALSLVTAGAVAASAGTEDGQGAQKRPLSAVSTDATGQCEDSESPDAEATGVYGFAILNAPGKSGSTERVIGEVHLHKADPDQQFAVFLAQDGACMPAGMLSTNGQGNGNAHIDLPAVGGTYYVVLQDLEMDERYATSPVVLR